MAFLEGGEVTVLRGGRGDAGRGPESLSAREDGKENVRERHRAQVGAWASEASQFVSPAVGDRVDSEKPRGRETRRRGSAHYFRESMRERAGGRRMSFSKQGSAQGPALPSFPPLARPPPFIPFPATSAPQASFFQLQSFPHPLPCSSLPYASPFCPLPPPYFSPFPSSFFSPPGPLLCRGPPSGDPPLGRKEREESNRERRGSEPQPSLGFRDRASSASEHGPHSDETCSRVLPRQPPVGPVASGPSSGPGGDASTCSSWASPGSEMEARRKPTDEAEQKNRDPRLKARTAKKQRDPDQAECGISCPAASFSPSERVPSSSPSPTLSVEAESKASRIKECSHKETNRRQTQLEEKDPWVVEEEGATPRVSSVTPSLDRPLPLSVGTPGASESHSAAQALRASSLSASGRLSSASPPLLPCPISSREERKSRRSGEATGKGENQQKRDSFLISNPMKRFGNGDRVRPADRRRPSAPAFLSGRKTEELEAPPATSPSVPLASSALHHRSANCLSLSNSSLASSVAAPLAASWSALPSPSSAGASGASVHPSSAPLSLLTVTSSRTCSQDAMADSSFPLFPQSRVKGGTRTAALASPPPPPERSQRVWSSVAPSSASVSSCASAVSASCSSLSSLSSSTSSQSPPALTPGGPLSPAASCATPGASPSPHRSSSRVASLLPAPSQTSSALHTSSLPASFSSSSSTAAFASSLVSSPSAAPLASGVGRDKNQTGEQAHGGEREKQREKDRERKKRRSEREKKLEKEKETRQDRGRHAGDRERKEGRHESQSRREKGAREQRASHRHREERSHTSERDERRKEPSSKFVCDPALRMLTAPTNCPALAGPTSSCLMASLSQAAPVCAPTWFYSPVGEAGKRWTAWPDAGPEETAFAFSSPGTAASPLREATLSPPRASSFLSLSSPVEARGAARAARSESGEERQRREKRDRDTKERRRRDRENRHRKHSQRGDRGKEDRGREGGDRSERDAECAKTLTDRARVETGQNPQSASQGFASRASHSLLAPAVDLSEEEEGEIREEVPSWRREPEASPHLAGNVGDREEERRRSRSEKKHSKERRRKQTEEREHGRDSERRRRKRPSSDSEQRVRRLGSSASAEGDAEGGAERRRHREEKRRRLERHRDKGEMPTVTKETAGRDTEDLPEKRETGKPRQKQDRYRDGYVERQTFGDTAAGERTRGAWESPTTVMAAPQGESKGQSGGSSPLRRSHFLRAGASPSSFPSVASSLSSHSSSSLPTSSFSPSSPSSSSQLFSSPSSPFSRTPGGFPRGSSSLDAAPRAHGPPSQLVRPAASRSAELASAATFAASVPSVTLATSASFSASCSPPLFSPASLPVAASPAASSSSRPASGSAWPSQRSSPSLSSSSSPSVSSSSSFSSSSSSAGLQYAPCFISPSTSKDYPAAPSSLPHAASSETSAPLPVASEVGTAEVEGRNFQERRRSFPVPFSPPASALASSGAAASGSMAPTLVAGCSEACGGARKAGSDQRECDGGDTRDGEGKRERGSETSIASETQEWPGDNTHLDKGGRQGAGRGDERGETTREGRISEEKERDQMSGRQSSPEEEKPCESDPKGFMAFPRSKLHSPTPFICNSLSRENVRRAATRREGADSSSRFPSSCPLPASSVSSPSPSLFSPLDTRSRPPSSPRSTLSSCPLSSVYAWDRLLEGERLRKTGGICEAIDLGPTENSELSQSPSDARDEEKQCLLSCPSSTAFSVASSPFSSLPSHSVPPSQSPSSSAHTFSPRLSSFSSPSLVEQSVVKAAAAAAVAALRRSRLRASLKTLGQARDSGDSEKKEGAERRAPGTEELREESPREAAERRKQEEPQSKEVHVESETKAHKREESERGEATWENADAETEQKHGLEEETGGGNGPVDGNEEAQRGEVNETKTKKQSSKDAREEGQMSRDVKETADAERKMEEAECEAPTEDLLQREEGEPGQRGEQERGTERIGEEDVVDSTRTEDDEQRDSETGNEEEQADTEAPERAEEPKRLSADRSVATAKNEENTEELGELQERREPKREEKGKESGTALRDEDAEFLGENAERKGLDEANETATEKQKSGQETETQKKDDKGAESVAGGQKDACLDKEEAAEKGRAETRTLTRRRSRRVARETPEPVFPAEEQRAERATGHRTRTPLRSPRPGATSASEAPVSSPASAASILAPSPLREARLSPRTATTARRPQTRLRRSPRSAGNQGREHPGTEEPPKPDDALKLAATEIASPTDPEKTHRTRRRKKGCEKSEVDGNLQSAGGSVESRKRVKTRSETKALRGRAATAKPEECEGEALAHKPPEEKTGETRLPRVQTEDENERRQDKRKKKASKSRDNGKDTKTETETAKEEPKVTRGPSDDPDPSPSCAPAASISAPPSCASHPASASFSSASSSPTSASSSPFLPGQGAPEREHEDGREPPAEGSSAAEKRETPAATGATLPDAPVAPTVPSPASPQASVPACGVAEAKKREAKKMDWVTEWWEHIGFIESSRELQLGRGTFGNVFRARWRRSIQPSFCCARCEAEEEREGKQDLRDAPVEEAAANGALSPGAPAEAPFVAGRRACFCSTARWIPLAIKEYKAQTAAPFQFLREEAFMRHFNAHVMRPLATRSYKPQTINAFAAVTPSAASRRLGSSAARKALPAPASAACEEACEKAGERLGDKEAEGRGEDARAERESGAGALPRKKEERREAKSVRPPLHAVAPASSLRQFQLLMPRARGDLMVMLKRLIVRRAKVKLLLAWEEEWLRKQRASGASPASEGGPAPSSETSPDTEDGSRERLVTSCVDAPLWSLLGAPGLTEFEMKFLFAQLLSGGAFLQCCCEADVGRIVDIKVSNVLVFCEEKHIYFPLKWHLVLADFGSSLVLHPTEHFASSTPWSAGREEKKHQWSLQIQRQLTTYNQGTTYTNAPEALRFDKLGRLRDLPPGVARPPSEARLAEEARRDRGLPDAGAKPEAVGKSRIEGDGERIERRRKVERGAEARNGGTRDREEAQGLKRRREADDAPPDLERRWRLLEARRSGDSRAMDPRGRSLCSILRRDGEAARPSRPTAASRPASSASPSASASSAPHSLRSCSSLRHSSLLSTGSRHAVTTATSQKDLTARQRERAWLRQLKKCQGILPLSVGLRKAPVAPGAASSRASAALEAFSAVDATAQRDARGAAGDKKRRRRESEEGARRGMEGQPEGTGAEAEENRRNEHDGEKKGEKEAKKETRAEGHGKGAREDGARSDNGEVRHPPTPEPRRSLADPARLKKEREAVAVSANALTWRKREEKQEGGRETRRPASAAPELLHLPITKHADAWSFGVTLAELAKGGGCCCPPSFLRCSGSPVSDLAPQQKEVCLCGTAAGSRHFEEAERRARLLLLRLREERKKDEKQKPNADTPTEASSSPSQVLIKKTNETADQAAAASPARLLPTVPRTRGAARQAGAVVSEACGVSQAPERGDSGRRKLPARERRGRCRSREGGAKAPSIEAAPEEPRDDRPEEKRLASADREPGPSANSPASSKDAPAAALPPGEKADELGDSCAASTFPPIPSFVAAWAEKHDELGAYWRAAQDVCQAVGHGLFRIRNEEEHRRLEKKGEAHALQWIGRTPQELDEEDKRQLHKMAWNWVIARQTALTCDCSLAERISRLQRDSAIAVPSGASSMFSPAFWNILASLLSYDAPERLLPAEALGHAWFVSASGRAIFDLIDALPGFANLHLPAEHRRNRNKRLRHNLPPSGPAPSSSLLSPGVSPPSTSSLPSASCPPSACLASSCEVSGLCGGYGSVARRPHAWFTGALHGLSASFSASLASAAERLALETAPSSPQGESRAADVSVKDGGEGAEDPEADENEGARKRRKTSQEGDETSETESGHEDENTENKAKSLNKEHMTSATAARASSSLSSPLLAPSSLRGVPQSPPGAEVPPWQLLGALGDESMRSICVQEAHVLSKNERLLWGRTGILFLHLFALKQKEKWTWEDTCSSFAAHKLGQYLLSLHQVKREGLSASRAAVEKRRRPGLQKGSRSPA
ncbi:hypothetical protein TGME49_268010 [Toxoplasma gondii ME49]|uniref:Protein kinase, PfEST homolog n=1 Tax=Toxoplasma gondii (strain ATCC 50611 / Me49) TaxID=508771 RepID=S8F0S5_TOXGM|nr:hypothetical protein TGME49_268010 [Toxoplasma gondii ME49]EPT28212.1 hypothetical protein TGME49_268010 [Toxoplasma gondii ME49]|eukprot:XP_002365518.1 hypothetical protein TGME49_268010 [Toxoplasma gondii ME49]